MPETFDLDRAFDDLTRDVAARSHPTGADRAVTTARRRRTSLGAVAAVAVLSVGGVVVSQLGGGSPAPQPGGPGNVTVAPEPAPRPLDAAALNEGFDGWAVWTQRDPEVLTDPRCLGDTPEQPVSGETTAFRSDPGLGAAFTNAVFASEADAQRAFDALVDDLEGCQLLEGVRPLTLESGRSAYAPLSGTPKGDDPQLIWLVQVDDRVGILTVVGIQDTPPDDVVPSVAAAMAADDPDA
jgi:hypothetical protein